MAAGFHTVTLGCKLNQFDGASIEGELCRRGLRAESDRARADVVVINTCTVTHRADADARKLIRAVRRENPGCTLLVTGCYASLDPQALRRLPVDRVFGNADKPRLGEILDELGIGVEPVGKATDTDALRSGDRGCDGAPWFPSALHFGERSRAFLKIQEGCRLVCSYCVIPQVRGPSRSVPPALVESSLLSLLGQGYREIVLTGVNTGDYGRDLEPRTSLADLLRRLLAGCGPNRIRLNSLEPLTVTDEIIDLLASEPRLAPHLQVPLQAGCDATLRRMRRNYRLAEYGDRIERLRREIPDIGLGADVIVGFPGETAEMFEESYRFVESSPLNYLHVFSWSPRTGTPAAEAADRVDPAEIRVRSARLRALGEALSYRFRRRFQGRRLDGVVLGERGGSGTLRVLTGNFFEVEMERGGEPRGGELIGLRIGRVTARRALARRATPPHWTHAAAPVSAG